MVDSSACGTIFEAISWFKVDMKALAKHPSPRKRRKVEWGRGAK